ncbi:MAG TPA: hypothetical protein VN914_09035 [Polyangia bacterium]|nr:hypothetical protein [Polyangia bacterium]
MLPKGGILVRRVGGHELVLFRTQAGHAAAPCSCPWPPTRLLAALAFREFRRDVEQDLIIWNNKRHITPPALALGDGPVGAYRKWARQFYEEAP